jgi:hypothetical protein
MSAYCAIAVILVDPPLGGALANAIYVEDPKEPTKRSWYPCKLSEFAAEPLPRINLAESIIRKPKYPVGRSVFKDLQKISHGQPSGNPWSITYGFRRLILAYATATLQRAFSRAINVQTVSTVGMDLEITEEISTFDFKEFERRAWNAEWEGRKFTKLWEQRENLELLRYKLRQNIQTIKRLVPKNFGGTNFITPALSPVFSPNPLIESFTSGVQPNVGEAQQGGDAQPEVGEAHAEGEEVVTESSSEAEMVLEWKKRKYIRAMQQQELDELREWTDLEATVEYINQVILRTTDNYLQTVAAGEAKVANFQARL